MFYLFLYFSLLPHLSPLAHQDSNIRVLLTSRRITCCHCLARLTAFSRTLSPSSALSLDACLASLPPHSFFTPHSSRIALASRHAASPARRAALSARSTWACSRHALRQHVSLVSLFCRRLRVPGARTYSRIAGRALRIAPVSTLSLFATRTALATLALFCMAHNTPLALYTLLVARTLAPSHFRFRGHRSRGVVAPGARTRLACCNDALVRSNSDNGAGASVTINVPYDAGTCSDGIWRRITYKLALAVNASSLASDALF